MTCLSDSTIVGLLERDLPSEQRAEIEAHLDACASCRRVVVDLTAVLTGSSTAAEDHTTHPARSSDHGPALELGAIVGRFVALGVIGRGGMGTVYTAYDPELDRNVALKLLHPRARTVDRARARILAEAQAMARISHPGVVAIYEVGTSRDRVFAAMELVEGTTLRAWITEQPRSWREVVGVFLLAGEGLAAAHAAGVVHRDFKPENVLLGRDGRVKVSDFGLSSLSPASDGGVAGTPGYLSVEAARGEGVDHRSDQFSFCVALYEALHACRPFSARTADDLAAEVRRGPVFDRRARGVRKQLDQIVRRGLALAPEDRHASMREMLDALRRTASRRSELRDDPRGSRRAMVAVGRLPIARATAAAALAGAVALVIAMRRGEAPALACEPPRRDVATVWSPAIAADLRVKASESHVAVLEAAYARWNAIRSAACSASPRIKSAQLHCLDGVNERFDALRRGFASAPGSSAEVLQENLVDPEVCHKPVLDNIPRLTLSATPGVIAALVLLGQSEATHKPNDTELTALAGASNPDPCARVIATLAFDAAISDVPRARSLTAAAAGPAEQCGDERLRADLRIQDAWYRFELPMVGPRGEAAIDQAQMAAANVMQPELEAALALQRLDVARSRGNWSEAFRQVETALKVYRARALQVRQVRTVIARNDLRKRRAEPSDLAAVIDDVQTWRPLAVMNHRPELAHRLDEQGLTARFWLGDVAGVHHKLFGLWLANPRHERPLGSRRITGDVADLRGRPVAGVTVAAASVLFADSVGINLPAFAVSDHVENDLRVVTSDSAGHFVIEDAAPAGVIAAELGAHRSMPSVIADHVKLVLEPTRSVSGKVDLAGIAHTRVTVAVAVALPTGQFITVSPVADDGSFTMMGVPTRAVRIRANEAEPNAYFVSRTVPDSVQPLTGVTLSLAPSTRVMDVIVRSTVAAELGGAQIIVASGRQRITTPDELWRAHLTQTGFARPAVNENQPVSVRDKIMPGDLTAHLEHVATGDLTVCAINFSGDWLDSAFRERWPAHYREVPLRCQYVGANMSLTVLRLPPQRRFD